MNQKARRRRFHGKESSPLEAVREPFGSTNNSALINNCGSIMWVLKGIILPVKYVTAGASTLLLIEIKGVLKIDRRIP